MKKDESKPTLEEVFLEFLDAVRQAPNIVAVNIAAGLALEAVQKITG